jgi:hypothetical protein
MKRLTAGILIIWLLWMALAVPLRAQQPAPITAHVDRTMLSVGETLNLTVTVNVAGFNTSQPELPPMSGFETMGSSTSSQFNLTNGEMRATFSYIYRLRAVEAGEWTIDAISVMAGGSRYSTQPIKITVTEGALPRVTAEAPADAMAPGELSGQDFFIEAEVDNESPYVGQAVTYTFRFYQAVNLFEQPFYDPPAFTGFWGEPQEDQGQYDVNAAGRLYRVTELYTVLFPTAVGSVTIEPARLTVPGSFFESDTRLETRPIDLEIKPLPDGAPADFAGAVGQYELTAEVDTPGAQVNQPVTLWVTLTGSGNLENLPDPDWPEMPNWRVFDSQATTNTEFRDGQINGSRVYERLLVPEKAGDAAIPPISYSFFDAQAGEYRTVSTQSIPLTVAPAEEEDAAVTVAVGPNKEEVAVLATDIRHLKPVPPVLNAGSAPLTAHALYWIGWGIPVLALAAAAIWQREARRRRQDPAWVRSVQAAGEARRAVQQAMQTAEDAFTAAGQILEDYLSDKLGQPTEGLTHEALASLLRQRGAETAVVQRVVAFRRQCEMGRYAPAAEPVDGRPMLEQVAVLVAELEGQLL